MAHHGQLRDYRFSKEVDDVRGTTLYGKDDEKLGTINDVIFEHATGKILYAVVDAGEFDQTRLFLVPAAEIHVSDKHPDDFAIDATSEKIKSLPRYNEETMGKDPDWGDYRKRYDEAWGSGPIMHKEFSTHTITPGPDELPAGTGSGVDDQAYMPDRIAGVFTDTSPDPSKIRMRPAGLAARAEDSRLPGTFAPEEKPTLAEEEAEERAASNPVEAQRDHLTDPNEVYVSERQRNARWAAFEDHLRRNRVDITASCRSCGTARDKVA
jgi:PRC-barrel domain